METRKKTYNKPLLQSEAFVPNEYVAACSPVAGATSFYLACTAEDSRLYLEDWGMTVNVRHSASGCKRATAFRVDIDNNTKKILHIYEDKNNSGYWDVEGECENIKVGGIPANEAPLSDPNGTYNLTWTTDVGYDMPHSGTLRLTTPISVNMS